MAPVAAVAPVTSPPVGGRVRPNGPSARDVRFAAILTVVQVGLTIGASHGHWHAHPERSLDAGAIVLAAIGPVALAWRRVHTLTVYAIVFAATLGYWVAGYGPGPIFLSLIIGFGTVVIAGYRRVAWASLVLGYVAFLWLGDLAGTRTGPSLASALGLAAWLLVLGTTTEIIRFRRERTIERAHVREEERRARANEERMRISRELHDVVAHNLSMINVQASTALHLIDRQPELAERALAAIKAASKDGLDELRSLLDVLRTGGDDDDERAAPRVPTPTLVDVDGLVRRTTAAGVPVELVVDGAPRPLPLPVETAAYRVTQEALTNVARHAGPAHTRVLLSYRPDALVVEIDDDGVGARVTVGGGSARLGPSSGKGLVGMRERVQALGGRLDAGPRPERGFRVRAWIPAPTRSSA
ncbi:MAG TPA: sensor histidine kinase [Acidimicrobiia bacterium]|jgi:signal transduction histidine kinase